MLQDGRSDILTRYASDPYISVRPAVRPQELYQVEWEDGMTLTMPAKASAKEKLAVLFTAGAYGGARKLCVQYGTSIPNSDYGNH